MAAQLNIKDAYVAATLRDWAQRDSRSVTDTLRTLIDREKRRRDAEAEDRLARMNAWADGAYAAMPEDVKRKPFKEALDCIYDDDEPDGFAR